MLNHSAAQMLITTAIVIANNNNAMVLYGQNLNVNVDNTYFHNTATTTCRNEMLLFPFEIYICILFKWDAYKLCTNAIRLASVNAEGIFFHFSDFTIYH